MVYNCTFSNNCLEGIETAIIKFDNNNITFFIEPLISNDVKKILEMCIQVTLFMTISLFGIIANVINITIYWKQGLKDSITLGFFALSTSDLFLVIMSLTTACCYAAKVILPNSRIDFPSVHYVSSGTFRNMGYSISSVLTAFLSLERCCCVVLPFKVKFIFTRSRTVVILVSIVVIHVVCYIPFFATQELRWKRYTSVNGTTAYILRVHFSKYRPIVEKASYILMGIVTPTLSQIIVTVSAVILTSGLRASSKFRKAMQPTIENNAKSAQQVASHENKNQENLTSTLSSRDARLVKAMIFLVAIMSMSNIPLLMITYAQSFIPELNIGKPYQNTYSTAYSIVYVLSSLNASVNIFVYYRTSVKYKEICKSFFKWSRKIS